MEKDARIYVAGHTGMVGSAIVRRLRKEGYANLLLRTHAQLDLTRQEQVEALFAAEKPEYVFLAAAKVGGIQANSEEPAEFFHTNMQIADNVIWAAHQYGAKKLLYLGSACMYPKECEQPMREKMLLTGLPEYTNEGYALAKVCGSRLCGYLRRQYGDDFISAIPANAYGPGDSFDPQHSHVIPALIRKFHEAKMHGADQVVLWGTGRPKREFIYVDDLADACLFLMESYAREAPINVGTGSEVCMLELSKMIGQIVGYQGHIFCDTTKPDGMMRRMVDSSKINALGWSAKTDMEMGLQRVYEWYIKNHI